MLGEVSVGYLPASFRAAVEKTLTRPLPRGVSVKRGDVSVLQTPGGGLAVQRGTEHYLLETSLTWPDGDRNWLRCPDRDLKGSNEEWRVVGSRLTAAGGQLVAEGRFYRLTRTLRFDGPRLRLADKLDNLTAEDLGVELSYHVSCGRAPGTLYLAGFGDVGSNYVDVAGSNPTLFAGQAHSGLGLLCEDDVLRNQLRLEYLGGQARAYSPGLGLAPRASYTCEWTLYPRADDDYWGFINQVRRDWQANFAIDRRGRRLRRVLRP